MRPGERRATYQIRPGERLLAWVYTGPLGHLYGTLADVMQLWVGYLGSLVRHRLGADAGLDA